MQLIQIINSVFSATYYKPPELLFIVAFLDLAIRFQLDIIKKAKRTLCLLRFFFDARVCF